MKKKNGSQVHQVYLKANTYVTGFELLSFLYSPCRLLQNDVHIGLSDSEIGCPDAWDGFRNVFIATIRLSVGKWVIALEEKTTSSMARHE
jgi:hypothetical protein